MIGKPPINVPIIVNGVLSPTWVKWFNSLSVVLQVTADNTPFMLNMPTGESEISTHEAGDADSSLIALIPASPSHSTYEAVDPMFNFIPKGQDYSSRDEGVNEANLLAVMPPIDTASSFVVSSDNILTLYWMGV
jgi:hypothetical protein